MSVGCRCSNEIIGPAWKIVLVELSNFKLSESFLYYAKLGIFKYELHNKCLNRFFDLQPNSNNFFLIFPESLRKLIHLMWIVCQKNNFLAQIIGWPQMIRKCRSLHWRLKVISVTIKPFLSFIALSFEITKHFKLYQISLTICRLKICIPSQLYSSSVIFEYLKQLLTRSQYIILNCFLCCIARDSCISCNALL